jgi:5-methylcytosine-specific restriction protein A
MTQDVGTTPRKPLTPTQRLKLFEAFQGRCVLCDRKIEAGEPWIDEHLRALGLGGTNAAENRGPAHKACADLKTHGKDGDLARIAKAKRQKMRHLGIRKPSTFSASRDSRFKKKINGDLVDRRTGEVVRRSR